MKRWIGLLLFLAILVPVLAQETATLEPTLTETPTPFPTLTEAATFAPTFTEPPTETATPISTFLPPETETPTLFSTETATLTPEFSSETATLTPTLTPTSWATETASPTLTATPEIVLVPFELTIPELPFTTLVPTEAVIELSIFFSNGTMEVALRDSGLGGYRVLLREDDQIGIFRDEELLGVIATSNLANIEHILRVSTLGNTFVFVLDGIELFNYVDVAPLADGNFQIITTGATVATAKVIGAWTSFTESAKEVPTMTNTPSAELLLVYSSTPTLTPEYYPSPTANNAQSFGVQAFGVTSSLPVKVVRVGTIANFYTALATANPSGNCVNNTYIQLTTGTLQRSGPLYATNGNNAFPIIKCPVTIIGSGNAGTTIIRPTAELTPYRFFAVDGSVTGQAHLTLQNIQLQGGYISQSDAAGGGAIIAVNGNVTLDRSRIFDNTVDVSQNLQTLGGGVYVFQGMLEVFSSIIRGNDVISPLPVPNTDGGGLAIVTGSINLQNNLIEQNTAERYGNLAYIQVSGSQGNAQRNCFFSPVISGAIDIYASSNTPLLGVTPPASGIGTPTLNPPPLSAPNNWWIATGTPGPRGTPYASPNAQGASINFGVQPYPFLTGTPNCATPTATPTSYIQSYTIANASLTPYANIPAVTGIPTPFSVPLFGNVTGAKIIANPIPSNLAPGQVNFNVNGFLVTDTAPLYAYPNSVPFGIHNIAATPYAYSGPSSLTVTPGVAGLAQVGLADAGCTPTDNLVSLLFSWDYPAREVQELKDMGVTTTTHIKVLSAPAMNADTVTTYNWGTRIKVYLRTAFTQTGYNPQVWYQVSLEGETVARGWIVVRYENKSYLYSDDVCNGDVQTISLSATLTFPYNRQAATNYAIEHSYQNDINNPQANGRTTRRLGSNNLSGTLIPFANFNYSYLSNSPGSTGSAMFVSEAIWAGGLPMTVGNTNSCSDFQLFNESGWRYCLVNVGSSNSWDYHQALIAHFTDSQAPSTTITNSILLETGYTNKGTRLNFPSSNTLHDDRIWGGRGLDSSNLSSDLVPFIPNPFTGVVTDVAGLATFASLNFGSLQAGDYVYINPFDNDNHGMLIAGWGPIEDCSLAVGTRYTITNFQSAYTTSVANIVPYIVDFTRAQSPTPRPFYCSLYLESGAFINFARHDWYFYTLGNVLTLRRDKIYTDPTWQWTSTDGN